MGDLADSIKELEEKKKELEEQMKGPTEINFIIKKESFTATVIFLLLNMLAVIKSIVKMESFTAMAISLPLYI